MVVAAQPASIAWAARDATTEQVAIGQKATVTLTAKDATIDAAVAGLRASVAMAARDAVGEGWSPALLPLTGWWRDYNGGNWTGKASAGTSGDNDLLDDGPEPSVGTALNGHGIADFNGSNDYLIAEGTLDTYVADAAASGWILFNADTDGEVSLLTHKPASAVPQIDLATYGGGKVAFNFKAASFVERAYSTGAWQLLTFRFNGATGAIQIGINEIPGAAGGDASKTLGATTMTPLTGEVYVGQHGHDGGFFDGKIAEIGLSDQVLSDQNFTDVLSYIEQRYGLSL